MSRADRYWLLWTGLPIVPMFAYAYMTTIRHDRNLGATLDPIYHIGLLFGSGLIAALTSLFVVGIPLRIAQNILIKERRHAYRAETIALIVAFASLCCMLYAMYAFPPEG